MTKQQQGKVANEFAPWDSDITKKKTLSKLVRKTRWGRDERDVRFNLNVFFPPLFCLFITQTTGRPPRFIETNYSESGRWAWRQSKVDGSANAIRHEHANKEEVSLWWVIGGSSGGNEANASQWLSVGIKSFFFCPWVSLFLSLSLEAVKGSCRGKWKSFPATLAPLI